MAGALNARRAQLVLVAVVQVLAMSMWFSASAVAPSLRSVWGLDAAQAAWLTSAVQLGFVMGAVVSVLLGLADRMPTPLLVAAAALGAAAATAAIALAADGFITASLLRFATGFFLAGVYPTGIKLMASWFPSAGRGGALGVLIGALTLGSALPHLIEGIATPAWQAVLLIAATAGVLAAVMSVAFVRSGPYGALPTTIRARHVFETLRRKKPLLVNLGYFGHMWELYALWTWIPAFLFAAGVANRADTALIVFAAMGVAGVAGCLLGGWSADRFGRARTAGIALSISGACCLLSPLFFVLPAPVLIVFVLVWGASVIADSGVFSTALSEVVEPRHVGSAATAQTAIGFFLTVMTINLVPIAQSVLGWQFALLILAPGPMIGVMAMRMLHRSREPT